MKAKVGLIIILHWRQNMKKFSKPNHPEAYEYTCSVNTGKNKARSTHTDTALS
jgi:hypothetical protein